MMRVSLNRLDKDVMVARSCLMRSRVVRLLGLSTALVGSSPLF
jgi:hypothetical protein